MPLLRVDRVSRSFKTRNGVVNAVSDVSFELESGTTLGIIGESGSGKSTLARLILRLIEADSGKVLLDGADVGSLSRVALRRARANMQIVFQEPYASLNPRLLIGAALEEPLKLHRPEMSASTRRRTVSETLELVGLDPEHGTRLPGELSGGQQQRVGIARAIITSPRLVVLDEPTSSLDLTVRAQVLDLLLELQRKLSIGYIFISHDMQTVEYISDRTVVMLSGQIVEAGATEQVFGSPQHEYTRRLLDARLSVVPRGA